MKYIFLDVDGVLNSGDRWDACRLVSVDRASRIDGRAVARLLRIVEQTGAVVVVSSTWRLYDDMLTGLCETLFKAGIDVVGYTSDLHGYRKSPSVWVEAQPRSAEIQKWLDECDDCDGYVIIDDDVRARIEGHYVVTLFEKGLLDQQVVEAVAILNG